MNGRRPYLKHGGLDAMRVGEVRKSRSRRHTAARRTLWFRTYRQRMNDGRELCRACGRSRTLTFGHLIPHVLGGPYSLDNVTILCWPCNQRQEDRHEQGLRSLLAEEAAAPSEQRWATLAYAAAGVQPPWLKGPESSVPGGTVTG